MLGSRLTTVNNQCATGSLLTQNGEPACWIGQVSRT
jgi:hypothetical protein